MKLYFKAEKLSKPRVAAVLRLMQIALPDVATGGVKPAIMDVARGRLLESAMIRPDVDLLLASDAVAFADLWERV